MAGKAAAIHKDQLARRRSGRISAAGFVVIAILLGPPFTFFGSGAACARVTSLSHAEFQTWLHALAPRLADHGISETTRARALSGLTLDESILARLVDQPEHNRAAGHYVTNLVSARRIAAGRDMLETHRPLLRSVAQKFGVDPTVVLAIWGIETSFGRVRGTSGVIRSLATLAASDQRRGEFWTKELIAALKILETRDVAAVDMTGSWAGAMGHTQFMPTTYHAYAVDFDGDGRRDIWQSTADALASSANYLKKAGWKRGEPWGFEVVLPERFDFSHLGPSARADIATWRKRGVVPARGPGWPQATGHLTLVMPSGAAGPVFLVTKNFSAIKRYNPSTLYALAVAQLADAIAGAPGLYRAWPPDDTALSRAERMELQTHLAKRYGGLGTPDGIIGRRTRAAIIAFQKDRGLTPDGHANKRLLDAIRAHPRVQAGSGMWARPQLSDASR